MVKIIAIGGGENGRPGTNYETKKIDEEIVKLSGKKSPKVLFIPPPSQFQESYAEQMKEIFVNQGCTYSSLFLNEEKHSSKFISSKILSSDIVYIGGGNTLQLMRYIKKYNLENTFVKAIKNDILMSGISAGAIIWFSQGCSDSKKYKNSNIPFIKASGLGFIDMFVCPHYDGKGNRKTYLKPLTKNINIPSIGLDNCCAIEIVDDKYRIITSNNNANAYKVYWKNGKYHEELIEKKKTYSYLDDLLRK